jgi:hypothetical protein
MCRAAQTAFEKAYGGQDLSPDEDQAFRAHPNVAASLLSNIPRLEVVAEIIRRQQTPDLSTMEQCEFAASLRELSRR